MPKVSVIIPTCNRAEYLRTAVASVLNQTFQDFEILIVDDASGDHTGEVVGNFHDDRITVLRHETRKGGAAARNTGIRNSTGDYLAFLDDDDEWFPDKLASQVEKLLSSPPHVGCVYTGYVTVDRASGKQNGQIIPQKKGDLSEALLASNCIGGTSSVLLKKQCFERVGCFDENLPSFQDYDLWVRVSKSFHFDYIREPMLTYYFHADKIWTNLDALSRGMAIMLEKHGSSRHFRKYLSYSYLGLGVRYCYRGDTGKARGAYLNAIKLYPFELRHYFNLGLSFFGPEIFTKIKNAKEKITASA